MDQHTHGSLPLTRHRGQANLEFIGVLAGMLLFILYGAWLWQAWRAKLNYMEATYTAVILNATRHTAPLMTGVGDYKGQKRAREIAMMYPWMEDYMYTAAFLGAYGVDNIGLSTVWFKKFPFFGRNPSVTNLIPVLPPASKMWDNTMYEGVPQLWIRLSKSFKGLGVEHEP